MAVDCKLLCSSLLLGDNFLNMLGMGLLPPELLHSLHKEGSSMTEGKDGDSQSEGRFWSHDKSLCFYWCLVIFWLTVPNTFGDVNNFEEKSGLWKQNDLCLVLSNFNCNFDVAILSVK